MSPVKYNPNLNPIRKNIPSVVIGPHTTKNVGSMKNYMEHFIKTILPNSENPIGKVSFLYKIIIR